MIYVAVITNEECPASPKIPTILAIFGALFAFRIVTYVLDMWVMPLPWFSRTFLPDLVVTLAFLSLLFLFLSCGFGLYFVITAAWPEFNDANAKNYCHPAVYILAVATFTNLLFGTVYWCTCFCCFYPRSEGKQRKVTTTDEGQV